MRDGLVSCSLPLLLSALDAGRLLVQNDSILHAQISFGPFPFFPSDSVPTLYARLQNSLFVFWKEVSIRHVRGRGLISLLTPRLVLIRSRNRTRNKVACSQTKWVDMYIVD